MKPIRYRLIGGRVRYETDVVITTEDGERTLQAGEVALRYSDSVGHWVAVSVDPARVRVLECSDPWCDGNAIDEAAEAFEVDGDNVVVDLQYV